jgi:hypothetical protein
LRERSIHVGHGVQHALAEKSRGVEIAQLDGLVLAGRCAGGNGGAAPDSAIDDDVGFHCGIAARVDDFSGDDTCDSAGHEVLPRLRKN